MPGLLGTKASVPADIALLLEIVILIILLVGRIYVKRKELKRHGLIMATAVVLHGASILLVMIPSFGRFLDVAAVDILSLGLVGVIIILVHVPLGLLAEALGILLVVQWRLRPSPEMACAKRRRLMQPLLGLWFFSLVLGIAIYAIYYL
jgi:uncharacterized membrane protein YozB (DUF420 family)